MALKPQDVLVALKILAHPDEDWAYGKLAQELGMSASEVHAAVQRLLAARLMRPGEASASPRLIHQALQDFLLHGMRYAFYAERGPLMRGMPTAHAAAPLNALIVADGEPPPVWPDPQGEARGYALAPLYKSVPHAARQDPELYMLLALMDALRDGRVREQALAAKALQARFAVEPSP